MLLNCPIILAIFFIMLFHYNGLLFKDCITLITKLPNNLFAWDWEKLGCFPSRVSEIKVVGNLWTKSKYLPQTSKWCDSFQSLNWYYVLTLIEHLWVSSSFSMKPNINTAVRVTVSLNILPVRNMKQSHWEVDTLHDREHTKIHLRIHAQTCNTSAAVMEHGPACVRCFI